MPQLLARIRRPVVIECLAVVAFYTAIAVFATWPLAVHPLGGFYGFGNDNWGGIPYLGWLHDAYLGPGDPSFDPELQAPFGFDLPAYALQPMDRGFSLALGGFEQGLGAYNAQIFLSFVLAGCTMYLLARYVTGDRLSALIAGFAFTFSPFHLAVAMQYNALASIQWIPLYLLALIVLLGRRRHRDAVLAGAAFALVAVTSYYYAWFVGWFTLLVLGCYAVSGAVRAHKDRRPLLVEARSFARLSLSRGLLALAVALLLAGPFLLTSAREASEVGSEAIEHPITEAVRYSARPWMLFVPPHDNPVVGDRIRPWIEQRLFDSPIYEQAVYLGYTLLALGIVALWGSNRRLRAIPARARSARAIVVYGFAAGLLIMLGPYVPLESGYWKHWDTPAATSHFPSMPRLMFELAPVFRFFTRAFVLVSACLAVLAAIGFARIAGARAMTQSRRVGLAAVVIALIGVEFANAPPHVWYSAERPPWVSAVAQLPPRAKVVNYPIASAISPRSLYYMFWQSEHRRWTANPALTPEAAALSQAISSIDDPEAGRALSDAGFDYAIVHTRLPPQTAIPYQPGSAADSLPPDTGSINPWLSVVNRTPDAVIYRVRSAPRQTAGVLARPADGFGDPEPEGRFTARWLLQPSGKVNLFVAGGATRITVTLTLSSFARPRRVEVRFRGRVVGAFPARSGVYETHRVPLGRLGPGSHTVDITSTPGPESIRAVTGTPDARSVSVRLREPVVVSTSRRR